MKREGALTLLIAALGLLGIVAFAARYVDRERAEIENKIVRSALANALANNGNALRPNTYWDSAYDNLEAPVNPSWARNNLGPYAAKTSDVSAVLVFNAAGRKIYSYEAGRLVGQANRMTANRDIQALERQARASRATPPVISTGFVRVDSGLYLGAASLVVPNDSRPDATINRKSVEVYLQEFSTDRMANVQNAFGISRPRIVEQPASGQENVMLRDARATLSPISAGRHASLEGSFS